MIKWYWAVGAACLAVSIGIFIGQHSVLPMVTMANDNTQHAISVLKECADRLDVARGYK